jgi:hypothetical protein
VEDEEALKAGALVSQLADPVQDQVHDFLSDGVVSARIVVGRVFLAGDELLGVEELAVGPGSDFVYDGGFEIDEDRTRDVLPRTWKSQFVMRKKHV